jgi:hypothetical protein
LVDELTGTVGGIPIPPIAKFTCLEANVYKVKEGNLTITH